jgi:hypothetical protein
VWTAVIVGVEPRSERSDPSLAGLQQGPDSLDAILTDLEAAWPDDG